MSEQSVKLTGKRELPEKEIANTTGLEPETKKEQEISKLPKPGKKRGPKGKKKSSIIPPPILSNSQTGEQSQITLRPRKMKYQKMKFNGEVYEIGDFVLIKKSDKTPTIGKIIGILREGGDSKHPKWPTVDIKRYVKKEDLSLESLGLAPKELRCLGENEVFETDTQEKMVVDYLFGKCKVWNMTEYDGKPGLGSSDFYSRAKYHQDTKTIDPPFSQWERTCNCNLPTNPNEMYVNCDKCQKWYHPECVGTTIKQATESKVFFCNGCQKSTMKESSQ